MNFIKKYYYYKQRIKKYLLNILNSPQYSHIPLVKTMKYSSSGGKKIRPLLIYATGEMFKVNLKSLDILATAIECIHIYSLIHDDLPAMDNDNIRRGKLASHVKYHEHTAILAGNAFQAMAFFILSNELMPRVSYKQRMKMISELAIASGINGICGGQELDLLSKNKKITLTCMNNIYYYKTVVLIRTAVRLGAIIAGKKGYKALPLLDKYSTFIGFAFQLQDDILNIIGNTKIMGKEKGTDSKNNKTTYPSLMGVKITKLKIINLYEKALSILKILSYKQNINTKLLQYFTRFIINRNK